MEILKRLAPVFIAAASVGQLSAQSTNALQRAFQSSYTDEGKSNYSAAISDIMPYYSDNNYELNLRLGWLQYLAKNYTSSQTYYLRAVNLRPNAVEARFGLVKPLSLLQSWDRVLDQYTAILRLDPQNTQANYWIGVIYYNRKDYTAATRYFSKVVNLYPFDYDGNHMLGWALLFGGKKQEARTYFERALLIKPEDTSSSEGLSKTR